MSVAACRIGTYLTRSLHALDIRRVGENSRAFRSPALPCEIAPPTAAVNKEDCDQAWHISSNFNTVRQFRTVLTVASRLSK